MLAAILTACGLLLAGVALRLRVPLLRRLFIPASLIGGLLGLAVVQVGARLPGWLGEPSPLHDRAASAAAGLGSLADVWRSWPTPLIAVVFAGLLLEGSERTMRSAVRGAAQAGAYAWVVILGQVAIGLGATALVVAPAYDVPPAFGQLIEAGFAGGHGTATALGAIYAELLDFPAGLDLGLVVATVGLLYSLLSGMVFVNVAVRRGWTRAGVVDLAGAEAAAHEARREAVAFGRLARDIVDPLAFQAAVVAMAFAAGMAMRAAFLAGADGMLDDEAMGYVANVPLFLFTLLGGWAVRRAMIAARAGDLLDTDSIRRIVAIAMEFLIVAAIASLRIEVVADYLWPLVLLCTLGFAWTGVCLLVLAPRLLPPGHWFELGIINYGMSTGTTAQGMLLLRIVDPDLESGAAEDYALAAPLSAPFIGGGVLTMTMPLLLANVPIGVVVACLAIAMTVFAAIALALRRTAGARRAA